MNKPDETTPEELFERYATRSDLPGYLDLEKLLSAPTHHEIWLIPNFIAKGRMTQIHGPAKSKKSMALLSMAACIATGDSFAGMKSTQAKVLYLDYENNPHSDIRVRLEKMGYNAAELYPNLIILSFPDIPCLDTNAGGAHLAAMVEMHEIDLVIIDTVSRTISGEENSNDTWSRFYNFTGKRLKQLGTAVVRIDHIGKDPSKGARGGSSKSTDVDIICAFTESKKVTTIAFLDGRIKSLFTKIDLTLEDEPALHFRQVNPPATVSTEMRVVEICAALDTVGYPRAMTNSDTRDALAKLNIPAAKTVSEEVARRRKETEFVEEDNVHPEQPRGWQFMSLSPDTKYVPQGYPRHPRKHQRPQGLQRPRTTTGR